MTAETTGATGLAGRYASALFALALGQGALEQVEADLRGLRALLVESADLRRLVRSPLISRQEQGQAIAAVLARAGVHDLTRRFVGVLANNRRLFALTDMVAAYLKLAAHHRREVSAEVISARPLSAAQVDQVRRVLERQAGTTVTIETRIDPGLWGGMVVKLGSRMVDDTLRNKLARLRLVLGAVN
ncbi:MAG: F0F1 ATP synthase subunit delta [Alphaproteobacteria bacterium]|nr:F0F1 ATP synthase subunit delta [Alphaproteobacteria bacterium]